MRQNMDKLISILILLLQLKAPFPLILGKVPIPDDLGKDCTKLLHCLPFLLAVYPWFIAPKVQRAESFP